MTDEFFDLIDAEEKVIFYHDIRILTKEELRNYLVIKFPFKHIKKWVLKSELPPDAKYIKTTTEHEKHNDGLIVPKGTEVYQSGDFINKREKLASEYLENNARKYRV